MAAPIDSGPSVTTAECHVAKTKAKCRILDAKKGNEEVHAIVGMARPNGRAYLVLCGHPKTPKGSEACQGLIASP